MWPAVGPHKERKVLPAGDCSAVKEEAWHFYGDNGVVRESAQFKVMTVPGGTLTMRQDVRRWEGAHDLKFHAPTWDWTTNTIEETFSCLSFPRILADCANDITASQVPDGNFGLGVPG